MKKTSLICAVFSLLFSSYADVGDYAIDGWKGTAYAGNGWFAYSVRSAEDGAVRLDNYTSFLLSPQYASPIRKLALKVKCSSVNPTRRLTVGVLVDGKEDEAEKVSVETPATAGEYGIVKISWESAENVTAVRLYLESGGSPAAGEWTLSHIYVFYGSESENEESVIEQIVNPLAVPGNLTVADFTATSLELAADEVANAAGYRFSLRPFSESGRFEFVEPFGSASEMSPDSGWTREAGENAKFDSYTGAATTDGDLKALKIEKGDAAFISPVCEGAITEYSLMYRNGTSDVSGKSNRLAVYGRKDDSSEWTEILPPFCFVTDTSKHHLTNAVDSALGIRQLKVLFTAGENPSATISVDSLRVASNGARTYGQTIEADAAEPRFSFTALERCRYEFKVKALAGSGNVAYADSEWSAAKEIDLAWAGLELTAPEGVSIDVSGDEMIIRWDEVSGAEYYLVDVFMPGQIEVCVVEGARTGATTFKVKVPKIGGYAVRVTACGPYGKSVSTASVAGAEVKPGAVLGLKVTEMTPNALSVAWSGAAFAEGYRVTLYELTGENAEEEVRSVLLAECVYVATDLTEGGKYRVKITPLPSGADELSASTDVLDLSDAVPRRPEPFAMHMLDNGVYRQSFAGLATVTKATGVKDIDLPYWQFYHADEPVETLRFSALGGKPTAGGVYVCSDAAKTADSYGLGSIASKESGCAYGLVMTNDRATAMNGFSVSFKVRQRTFKQSEKSLALEYLISSEAVTMASAGDWRALEIPITAPKTEATCGGLSEYVQDISVSAADIEVRPGEMIAFRWRDPAMASSPLTNIDDVCIACTFEPAPMLIKVK